MTFPALTVRLAESLRSIPYPERAVNTDDVFRVQCVLDMAMVLHTKVPGVVDKSLFQALHDYSVRMFDLEVKKWLGMVSRISKRNNSLPTDNNASGNVVETDWERVLREDKYVGVQIRDNGNYGVEWYQEDLRLNCKQRIEFMLSYLEFGEYKERFPLILETFEIDVHT